MKNKIETRKATKEIDYGHSVGVRHGREITFAEIEKVVDEMFPICTCIDGMNGKEPNLSCKNELMDGAWTNGINKEFKSKLQELQNHSHTRKPLSKVGPEMLIEPSIATSNSGVLDSSERRAHIVKELKR